MHTTPTLKIARKSLGILEFLEAKHLGNSRIPKNTRNFRIPKNTRNSRIPIKLRTITKR